MACHIFKLSAYVRQGELGRSLMETKKSRGPNIAGLHWRPSVAGPSPAKLRGKIPPIKEILDPVKRKTCYLKGSEFLKQPTMGILVEVLTVVNKQCLTSAHQLW